jgi:hypothetical protein
MRPTTAVTMTLAAVLAATPAFAQRSGALDRIRALDVEQVESGRVTVLYSDHDGPDADTGREMALRVAAPLQDAADFFAGQLGGDFRFTLALLSPRDWGRTAGSVFRIPWHSQPDRLMVLPVRTDLGMMETPDTALSRKTMEVVSLHQLGHIVTAVYFQPAGFREPAPPVRWFDELLASYFSYAYMGARKPELAEFMTDLARDVTRRTEPRFSSLPQYDAFYETYLSAPTGADNLGWYHNAFNLRAAELYRKHGDDLMQELRQALPWSRIESWTTEELLDLLEPIAPDFLAWSEEMASKTRRRY